MQFPGKIFCTKKNTNFLKRTNKALRQICHSQIVLLFRLAKYTQCSNNPPQTDFYPITLCKIRKSESSRKIKVYHIFCLIPLFLSLLNSIHLFFELFFPIFSPLLYQRIFLPGIKNHITISTVHRCIFRNRNINSLLFIFQKSRKTFIVFCHMLFLFQLADSRLPLIPQHSARNKNCKLHARNNILFLWHRCLSIRTICPGIIRFIKIISFIIKYLLFTTADFYCCATFSCHMRKLPQSDMCDHILSAKQHPLRNGILFLILCKKITNSQTLLRFYKLQMPFHSKGFLLIHMPYIHLILQIRYKVIYHVLLLVNIRYHNFQSFVSSSLSEHHSWISFPYSLIKLFSFFPFPLCMKIKGKETFLPLRMLQCILYSLSQTI